MQFVGQMELPSHVFVQGYYTKRESSGMCATKDYDTGDLGLDLARGYSCPTLVEHFLPGGRTADKAPSQVYTTFEKCLEALKTDMKDFVYNGNDVINDDGLCMVMRSGNTYVMIKKLWLNPKDHVASPAPVAAAEAVAVEAVSATEEAVAATDEAVAATEYMSASTQAAALMYNPDSKTGWHILTLPRETPVAATPSHPTVPTAASPSRKRKRSVGLQDSPPTVSEAQMLEAQADEVKKRLELAGTA